jgi:hypothetical protein
MHAVLLHTAAVGRVAWARMLYCCKGLLSLDTVVELLLGRTAVLRVQQRERLPGWALAAASSQLLLLLPAASAVRQGTPCCSRPLYDR